MLMVPTMTLTQRLNTLLRSVPIEFHVLAWSSAILCTTAWYLEPSAFRTIAIKWLFADIGSATLASYFFLSCIAFLVWIIGSRITRPYRTRASWFDTHSLRATLPGALMFLLQVLSAVLISELAVWLFHATPQDRTLAYSVVFLKLDTALFGPTAYESLVSAIAPHPILSHLVITTYEYFALLPILTALLLVIRSVHLFREYFMGFTLLHLFALPVWYLIPALAPAGLLLDHALPRTDEVVREERTATERVHAAYAGTYWAERTDAWRTFWKRDDGSLPVSTNPSMHVAWGMLVVLYLFRIAPLLGYAGATLQVLSSIGTVYLLQHYTVDTVTGCALAVLAYYAARALLTLERRFLLVDTSVWFTPWCVAREWVHARYAELRHIVPTEPRA